jgi:hypothetical protein
MEDERGKMRAVPVAPLAGLFRILKDNVRCVVHNACYSEGQAVAIAQDIDVVIGMTRAVRDVDAICFSTAFYEGIGFNRTLQTCFDLGSNSVPLETVGPDNIPKMVTRARIDPDAIRLL